MAFEQKDDSGALFKNKRKAAGDDRPEYTGPCKVNGVEMEMSAWLKKDRNENSYMSVSFQPKWEAKPKRDDYREAAQPVRPEVNPTDPGQPSDPDDPFSDEIPF